MVREIGFFDSTTTEPELPFTLNIMIAKYPCIFHLPWIKPYDGQRDRTEQNIIVSHSCRSARSIASNSLSSFSFYFSWSRRRSF